MSEATKSSDFADAKIPVGTPSIHAVDTSDLATLIASAHARADDAATLAGRLEVLMCGLSGEACGVYPAGPPADPAGLGNLANAMDRLTSEQNRASGYIDRLNSLVAIGG